MKSLRILLKKILAWLAKWAIRKHNMEIIVILGINGTEITKELCYYVLSSKYKVRRVTHKPWWDLSIPLSILGYKDKRRGLIEWIVLIIRSFIYLLIGPKNESSIIINLNYLHKDTMRFWGEIIFPDILILSNFNNQNNEVQKFIDNTNLKQGKILIQESNLLAKSDNYLKVGKGENCFLSTKTNDKDVILTHENESITIKGKSLLFIPLESFEFALALGIIKNIPLNESVEYAMEFDYPSFLSKIKTNLKKSEY